MVEDPSSLQLNDRKEEGKHVEAYCSILKILCNSFLKCYKGVEGISKSISSYVVDNTFFAVVHPGMKSSTSWTSTRDVEAMNVLYSQCEHRLSSIQNEESSEPKFVNYRYIYDSLMKLKEELSSSDLVDVIWLVPDLEAKAKSRFAVPADVDTASFLYIPLKSFLDSQSCVKVTILSTKACNDLYIWAKLLKASIYWTTPSSFPSAIPDLPPSDITTEPAETNSLIIETTATFPQKPQAKKTSRLPTVTFHRAFEVSPAEMEIVCMRLLAPGVRSRCILSWKMQDDHFLPYFGNAEGMVGTSCWCSAGILTNHSDSSLLDTTKPIQLISRFHPIELMRDLHLLLTTASRYSLVMTHPSHNEISLLLGDSQFPAFFGCSVVTKIPAKSAVALPFPAEASIHQAPKEEVGVGVLVVSYTSTELYVVPPSNSQNLPFLTTLLLEAFQHPQYCLILENDVDSQLTKIRLKNDDDSMSEFVPLFDL